MSTLVGEAHLKDAVLSQDGPDDLLASDPLRGESTRVSPLNMEDINDETGGPWKPTASHNAWS